MARLKTQEIEFLSLDIAEHNSHSTDKRSHILLDGQTNRNCHPFVFAKSYMPRYFH